MIKIAQLVFLFCLPLCVQAQSVDLNRKVTLRYKNQRLGFILSDVSRKYGIPFSYSSNFIPVKKRITISERNIPLGEGLHKLFAPTQIIYAVIGNSIALKIDESKEVITIIETPIERNRNIQIEEISFLKKSSYPILVWEHRIPAEILAEMKIVKTAATLEVPEKKEDGFLAEQMVQVTLIPPYGTNKELAKQTTNTFSFNVLWGKNGGLSGLEIGGFVNTITNNMRGFQLAGVGNHVKGDAQGGQLATIFNYNKGFTKGVQASLFNIANTANIIQLAGIANFIQADFEGVQAALVSNYAKEKADMQFSLGINKASEVKTLQVGLVNIADKVVGRQIGLVNLAKKAEQTPFGLLNIIKDGYNRIEVGGNDALYASVGIKTGMRKFYNIFQFGSRFTEDIWSLGYGFGTAFKLKERQYFHLEYVASHVNEGDVWTKELNLLNQFKFNFDWEVGESKSLFLGPSWNLLASKRIDTETLAVIGSSLPDYTILDTTRKNTNWKMWFGINGGFRF
ncbi:MAG: hypothetical protein AB8G86_01520 [Saprospiraceae bacterium]